MAGKMVKGLVAQQARPGDQFVGAADPWSTPVRAYLPTAAPPAYRGPGSALVGGQDLAAAAGFGRAQMVVPLSGVSISSPAPAPAAQLPLSTSAASPQMNVPVSRAPVPALLPSAAPAATASVIPSSLQRLLGSPGGVPPLPTRLADIRFAASAPVLQQAAALGGEAAARVSNPNRVNAAIAGGDGPDLVPASGGLTTASVDMGRGVADNLSDVVEDMAMGAAVDPAQRLIPRSNRVRRTAPIADQAVDVSSAAGSAPARPAPAAAEAPAPSPSSAGGGNAASRRGFGYWLNDTLEKGWNPVDDAAAKLDAWADNPNAMAGRETLKRKILGAGRFGLGAARMALPVAGLAMTGVPIVTNAMEGNEKAGVGGAAIGGGVTALGGVIGGIATGFNPLGIAAGSALASVVAQPVVDAAVGAVDAAQGGDSGPIGTIGRILDPVITSARDREQAEVFRQLNSPVAQAIMRQQQLREMEARTAAMEHALMNAYA